MKEVNEILKQIKEGNTKSVYVFDGEEAYYTDILTDAFEKNVLQEHEKDFNFKVFFGKDSLWQDIVNECRSYPVFAGKRLVILKEASQLKDFDALESYIKSPASTTILVIAHKYKKIDGRSSIAKTIKKNATYYTFDKIRDYNLPDWIMKYCQQHSIKISMLNAEMLAAYLGTDLHKIANELEKVRINMKEGEEVSEALIEKYIGISKDYNVFQYPQAVLERNFDKTYKVMSYYIANPKEAPMQVITVMLYNEFCKLYKYHYAKNLPQAEIAKAVGIGPYFVKDYQRASQHFDLSKTIQAIDIIHQYNLHAMGVDIASNEITMLKELTFKLLSL